MANNKRSAKHRKKTGEREWSGLLNPLHGSPPPSRSPHYLPFSPNIACKQAPLFGRAKQYIVVTQLLQENIANTKEGINGQN